MDRIEKLKELAELYASKLISREEFEKLKKELMDYTSESTTNNNATSTDKEDIKDFPLSPHDSLNEDKKEVIKENYFGNISLTDNDFVSFKDLQLKFESDNKEIIDSTAHCQNGDLIVPSIYLLESSQLDFKGSLAIPGLFFSLWSFNKWLSLCLEEVQNPYIKHFRPEKNRYNMILSFERNSIIDFNFERNIEFKAVKPKKSYQFLKNMGHGAAIGGLIGNLILKGGAKLGAKIEEDTYRIKGDIFTLKYKNQDKIEELKIASERNNSPAFLIHLRDHWSTEIPKFKEEPYTHEEFRKVQAELLMVGDKVRIPRFWNYDEGLIIKKGEKEAIVKTIKNGIEKEEAIKYSKLTLIQ